MTAPHKEFADRIWRLMEEAMLRRWEQHARSNPSRATGEHLGLLVSTSMLVGMELALADPGLAKIMLDGRFEDQSTRMQSDADQVFQQARELLEYEVSDGEG